MPRLSIILPVRGNPAHMEESLASVLQNRPRDCEILVLMDEPYGDPYELKDEVRFIELPAKCGLIDGLNRAIMLARSPVVMWLTCGVETVEGWCDAALARFADPKVAGVTPVVIERGAPDRVLTGGQSYHASGRLRRLGDAAAIQRAARGNVFADADLPVAFLRKSAVEAVGRFDCDMGDALATIDLGQKLRTNGWRWVVEPDSRLICDKSRMARPWEFRRAVHEERLFWRWAPRRWRSWHVARHGAMVAAELLGGWFLPRALARFAGRLSGLFAKTPEPAEVPPATIPIKAPHFVRRREAHESLSRSRVA